MAVPGYTPWRSPSGWQTQWCSEKSGSQNTAGQDFLVTWKKFLLSTSYARTNSYLLPGSIAPHPFDWKERNSSRGDLSRGLNWSVVGIGLSWRWWRRSRSCGCRCPGDWLIPLPSHHGQSNQSENCKELHVAASQLFFSLVKARSEYWRWQETMRIL